MQRRTRRIFFYGLVLFFFCVSPILIGYSFGYTFDFSRARFEQTGGIFIKSKTPRMSVFLDGAFIRETGLITGSILLSDLRPKSHLVRLEKQGFHAWSKVVNVSPSLVTELRAIVLVPNPVTIGTSTPETIETATSFVGVPLSRDRLGNLYEDLQGSQKIIAPNVHSYGITHAAVFFVDKNGFFARYDRVTRAIDTIGRPGFYLGENPVRIKSAPSGDIVLVLDSSGGLFLFREATKEIKPVDGGIKEIGFDGEEEKILLQKERSIEILWLKDNRYQPSQRAGAKENIFTSGEEILEAKWFYQDNAHIVYRTREGVFFTEIDTRGGRNTVILTSGKISGLTTIPGLPHAIFFTKGKVMYRIEL